MWINHITAGSDEQQDLIQKLVNRLSLADGATAGFK
jgi:hypothetical protein